MMNRYDSNPITSFGKSDMRNCSDSSGSICYLMHLDGPNWSDYMHQSADRLMIDRLAYSEYHLLCACTRFVSVRIFVGVFGHILQSTGYWVKGKDG